MIPKLPYKSKLKNTRPVLKVPHYGTALGGADGGAGHVLLEEHAHVEIDIVLVVIDGQDLTPARVHRWLLAPVKLAEFRVAHAKGFHRFIPGNAMLTATLKYGFVDNCVKISNNQPLD